MANKKPLALYAGEIKEIQNGDQIDSSLYSSTGGSGGSSNFIQVQVDFGYVENDVAYATILASWVQSNSIIVCTMAGIETVDHDSEDVIIEGIVAYPINIIPGYSFDVECYAPNSTWGKYIVNIDGK